MSKRIAMDDALLRFGPYIARTTSKLGSGNYGTVLAGMHAKTGAKIAVKIEPDGSGDADRARQSARTRLSREAEVYRDVDGFRGFPRMHWFGRAHGYIALVLDRLGPSMREVHQESKLELDAHAVRHVGREALLRLEALHDAGWLHMDVKPANLLLPRICGDDVTADESEPLLHLVDFGLSRRWTRAVELPPEPRRRRAVVGTGRFASLANHEGEAPLGRRDDVESTLLSLAYLRLGRLPWTGLNAPTKRERFALMLDSKREVSIRELSVGMFDGFEAALTRVRALDAGERPPYEELRSMLAKNIQV